jgi:hypothetical protein
MKDVEIVVFNDKSWVRFIEYQKLDEENKQLKEQIEKMKNCDNCKNLIQCTNRRYEKMTSGKITKIMFPCCWELAE